jgi:hypothetical protein
MGKEGLHFQPSEVSRQLNPEAVQRTAKEFVGHMDAIGAAIIQTGMHNGYVGNQIYESRSLLMPDEPLRLEWHRSDFDPDQPNVFLSKFPKAGNNESFITLNHNIQTDPVMRSSSNQNKTETFYDAQVKQLGVRFRHELVLGRDPASGVDSPSVYYCDDEGNAAKLTSELRANGDDSPDALGHLSPWRFTHADLATVDVETIGSILLQIRKDLGVPPTHQPKPPHLPSRDDGPFTG